MLLKNNLDLFLFYKVPSYLFILIPVFLITGPFLSDLAISLISILFLVYCVKYKDYSFFKNKYFSYFIIFYVYLVINSLINNFNLDSFRISIFYFRFGLFVVAILAILKFNHIILKNFFYCLYLCFIILIFDGFFQYFFDENILGWSKAHEYRVSSLFGDELILGSYISRLFPIFFALGYFYYSNKKLQFNIIILIFILAEVLIFLSGERTSFFYINLSAFFIIIFSKNLKILRLTTLTISFILIILISIFNEKAKYRIVDMTINQIFPEKQNVLVESKNKKDQIYIFSKQHTHHYLSAYKMYLDNKFIGVGVKNFKNFCANERYIISNLSCSTHPHNSYIQLLSEVGIIGFSFLFFCLIYFCRYLFKHIKLNFSNSTYFNDFEICILSGILITLWPLAPTGNFFNNWLSIIYFLSLPILGWSRIKSLNP